MDWRERISSELADKKALSASQAQEARAKHERESAVATTFIRPGAELFVEELKRQGFDARVEDAGDGVDVMVNGVRRAWMVARVCVHGPDRGYQTDFYLHGEVGYEQCRGNNALHGECSPDQVAEQFANLFLECLRGKR